MTDYMSLIPAMMDLLPVRERVRFKVALLMHVAHASYITNALTLIIRLVAALTALTVLYREEENKAVDKALYVAEPFVWNSSSQSLKQLTVHQTEFIRISCPAHFVVTLTFHDFEQSNF